MIDIRQSVHYADYLMREGWIVERIDGINYFIRRFPLIGSVLKLQRPDKIYFEAIDRLCRKYRVFHIIIEPKSGPVVGHGFKLSKSPYLPTKTLQIALTQSKKAIFGHFKKDARQAIKKPPARRAYGPEGGEANIIKSYSTDLDIGNWREGWRNSVNFKRFVPSAEQLINLRKSFGPDNSLFLASHNISGNIIGGALFTISSHETSNYISYYWYGFTNKEGRSSLSQYSLLWHGILWAKKMGCKVFDFEGIFDERFPIRSWLGFSHFKKSFGGHEVEYPGCYTKWRFPWILFLWF